MSPRVTGSAPSPAQLAAVLFTAPVRPCPRGAGHSVLPSSRVWSSVPLRASLRWLLAALTALPALLHPVCSTHRALPAPVSSCTERGFGDMIWQHDSSQQNKKPTPSVTAVSPLGVCPQHRAGPLTCSCPVVHTRAATGCGFRASPSSEGGTTAGPQGPTSCSASSSVVFWSGAHSQTSLPLCPTLDVPQALTGK